MKWDDKMEKALSDVTESSNASKDDYGERRPIFRDLPMDTWNPEFTDNSFDLVPWIAGKKYPTNVFSDRKIKAGDPTYILVVYVHRNIGPNQDDFVCPAKNYGKPCPICEYLMKKRADGDFDEDEEKDLRAKKRACYQVIVRTNNKQEQKGLQVWYEVFAWSEKKILKVAKVKDKGVRPFASPSKGWFV